MKQYFIHDGRTALGPYSLLEVKQQILPAKTPVWFDGISEWITIKNIKEFDGLENTPSHLMPRSATQVMPPLNKTFFTKKKN